jgi:hypothetical protein
MGRAGDRRRGEGLFHQPLIATGGRSGRQAQAVDLISISFFFFIIKLRLIDYS